MIFNGIEKDYLIPSTGRRRPAWAPVTRQFVSVPGMAGAHLSYTETQIREITVPITIEAKNIKDLQKVKEDLAEWLIHDEPKELVFKDEPDRIYYAIVDGSLDLDEIVRYGRGEITFVCADPYKYGPEKHAEFQDSGIVENEGTAEADPIFELEVLQPVTFAMVSNGEEYNMIGRPVEVEDIPFQREQLIMHDTMSTTTGWTKADSVDNGFVTGEMQSDGNGFYPSTFGTVEEDGKWQGPSLRKSLPELVQDFKMEALVNLQNIGYQTGMIEIYLRDAADNNIAKIGIEDRWASIDRVYAKAVLGGVGGEAIASEYANFDSYWNNYNGVLRIERINNAWWTYFAIIDEDGRHIHRRRKSIPFVDVDNLYTAPIAQVQVAMRKYPNTVEAPMRVNDIKVWKINQQPEEIPYIAQIGDIITFDHRENVILINGEPRKDLKDFGGNYFKLAEGVNALVVMPENSFETKVTYRERYR